MRRRTLTLANGSDAPPRDRIGAADVGGVDETVDDAPRALLRLVQAEGIVPAGTVVLSRLLRDLSPPDIRRAQAQLLARGSLLRVWLGHAWHLTLPEHGDASLPTAGCQVPAEDPDGLEALHRAQVRVDIARERLLAIRIVAVLSAVSALLLSREVALTLLGL